MAPTLREGLKTWNIPADASSGRKWPETAGAISLSSPFQGAGVRVELSGCLGRFLVSQLSEPDCLVLVAEDAGQVVGYVFAQSHADQLSDLRGPCGFVHDVMSSSGSRPPDRSTNGGYATQERSDMSTPSARTRQSSICVRPRARRRAQQAIAATSAFPGDAHGRDGLMLIRRKSARAWDISAAPRRDRLDFARTGDPRSCCGVKLGQRVRAASVRAVGLPRCHGRDDARHGPSKPSE